MNEKMVEKLPGDLKKLASLIGVENTMKIVDHWGGGYIVIPMCADLKREDTILEAQKLYDGGGYTQRTLAMRFKVSRRTIATWLKKAAVLTANVKEGK